MSAPPAETPKSVVKVVAELLLTYGWRAEETASVFPTTIIDLGAPPYPVLKVMVVLQVDAEPPVPVVMLKDPAESVEPAVMAAEGLVPQLDGVLMVGAVV